MSEEVLSELLFFDTFSHDSSEVSLLMHLFTLKLKISCSFVSQLSGNISVNLNALNHHSFNIAGPEFRFSAVP